MLWKKPGWVVTSTGGCAGTGQDDRYGGAKDPILTRQRPQNRLAVSLAEERGWQPILHLWKEDPIVYFSFTVW